MLLLVLAVVLLAPSGITMAVERAAEAILWVIFLAAVNLVAIPILPRVDVEASLGSPVTIASAVLFDPPLAALLNVIGFTNEREFQHGTSAWAIVFNRSQNGLAAAAASWCAAVQPWGLIAGTAIAAVVYNVINTVAVGIWVNLRGRAGLRGATRAVSNPFPRFAVDYGLVALLAVAIVLFYVEVAPWAVVLLVAPGYLGYSAMRSARVAEDRAEELAARVRDLEILNALSVELLSTRRADDVTAIASSELARALDFHEVEVSLAGTVASHLRAIKVPGVEPAVIGVPTDLPDRSLAVVEAAAALLGMALQRLELESAVAAGQRARVALSGQILEEGTRERSRIGLEIHDEVLPYLAAAEIQADNVRSAMIGGDADRADRLVSLTRDAVAGGVVRLREVLEALRRQVVVPGGLRQGLNETLDELGLTTGIQHNLVTPEPMPELPLAVEIIVLELVRGCLTNVARHANATYVEVRIEAKQDVLVAKVCDNGQGFDPQRVPAGHHGLQLMAQRIELARGRFAVDSAPGSGTRVVLEVPL
ncbi:MAG: ATP-binding protein [Actinomycetota bacterium]|nr:ATP-binding protein [Actinomycetota bacterium]